MCVVRRSGKTKEGRRIGHCLLGKGGGDAAGRCVWIYQTIISIGFGATEVGKRMGKAHLCRLWQLVRR